MTEPEVPKGAAEHEAAVADGPLVFVSHDSRDAELAEAFSKLLKSVSAGMIKTFRSTDKKGADGISFGDEWYKRLMSKLQSTSDVVCLFTERSLGRPWLLFEAGVAKGKLNTPVVGIALGVPLSRVSEGPFYQFQNMDDSEADLTKLVHQLAQRVPGLELDADVVKTQVQAFKTREASLFQSLAAAAGKKAPAEDAPETSVAKLLEEMKTLPSRVAQQLAEAGEPYRRRRVRRFYPGMLERFVRMTAESGEPVAILLAASTVRDDMPWLYELAMEVYRTVKSGNTTAIKREVTRLYRVIAEAPFPEEFFGDREAYMFAREFPQMIEHIVQCTLEMRKSAPRGRILKPQAAEMPGEPS